MILRIAPALLGILLALLFARPAAAAPAMFVARAPGATIYLLGSIHGLSPSIKWETPAIDQAFDAADQRFFEAILADARLEIMALTMTYGIDPQGKLLTYLTPAETDQLRRLVAELKVPGGMDGIVAMRPWLASLMLSALRLQQQGIDPEYGVDTVLQARASAARKTMVGFENAEQQVRILADIPDRAATAMLRTSLKGETDMKALIARLLQAWTDGDIDAVGREFTALEEGTTPEILEAAVLRRNAAWAKRLETLKGSGTTAFVTVGAAHLAGPESLRDLLTRAGFTIERVQ